jgi:hypothetical protein
MVLVLVLVEPLLYWRAMPPSCRWRHRARAGTAVPRRTTVLVLVLVPVLVSTESTTDSTEGGTPPIAALQVVRLVLNSVVTVFN